MVFSLLFLVFSCRGTAIRMSQKTCLILIFINYELNLRVCLVSSPTVDSKLSTGAHRPNRSWWHCGNSLTERKSRYDDIITKKKEETQTLVTIHDLGYVKVLHPVQLRNFPWRWKQLITNGKKNIWLLMCVGALLIWLTVNVIGWNNNSTDAFSRTQCQHWKAPCKAEVKNGFTETMMKMKGEEDRKKMFIGYPSAVENGIRFNPLRVN